MSRRRYTLKQRAEAQQETRRRIVEATARLHEEVGPRAATISAIAKAAGVQRLTVYRHFPDEAELFKACTSHWLALNPPPEPSRLREAGLPRVRKALNQLYGYYRRTQRMWTVSYRDEADVPGLEGPMRQVRVYLHAFRDDLVRHLEPELNTTHAARPTLGHAVQFSTWQSLDREGLGDADMADLVCNWLSGAGCRTKPVASSGAAA